MPGGLHPWTRFNGSLGWISIGATEIHVNGMLVSRPVTGQALLPGLTLNHCTDDVRGNESAKRQQ